MIDEADRDGDGEAPESAKGLWRVFCPLRGLFVLRSLLAWICRLMYLLLSLCSA